jgi:hypothetical protein
VLGFRVHLVGVSISFEKNFYQLPFTPPLSGHQFRSFTRYQRRLRILVILTSLRSKHGVLGTGFGSSALRWEELPDVVETDGCVPPWKGSDPLDVTVNTTYVHPINHLAPGSRDMFDANNKVVDYLFRALCQS